MYVRQSLDKTGDEAAVERQEAACKLLAQAKGWDDLAIYRDNDRSATSGKERPEFERLIRDVENGRITELVVFHLDRLTRTIRDLTRVIEAGKTRRLNIASVNGVSLDLGDPTGVAVATILTAIAAMEVQHKGVRQKAANRQRATQGKAHWIRRPYGYQRIGDTATMVPDEAAHLRDAADRITNGETLASIVRDWNGRGLTSTYGKPWNVTSLRRSLINPRTAGRRLYNGEDMGPGEWEAIFTEEQHRDLEAKLTDPRRRTAPHDLTAKFLLSGVARCGKCGKPMFAAAARKGGHEWMVYRCFGGYCMARRLDLVDEVVESVVIGVLSRPDAHRLFAADVDVQALRQKAVDLRDRRDALAALLADGLMSASSVREQAGKLSADLTAVEDALNAADTVNPAAGVIDAPDVPQAWRNLPMSAKRRIVRALMSVTVLPAGKGVRFAPEQVQIEWRNDRG